MIYCCKGCEAPKRYPGCHSVCQEYLEQKAEHDKIKEVRDKEHHISCGIYQERGKKVYNAMKSYRGSKWREK